VGVCVCVCVCVCTDIEGLGQSDDQRAIIGRSVSMLHPLNSDSQFSCRLLLFSDLLLAAV
jgi:hypothetical protein